MRFAAPRLLAREPKAGQRAAGLGIARPPCLRPNLHQTSLLLSEHLSLLHANKQWATGQTGIQARTPVNDLMP